MSRYYFGYGSNMNLEQMHDRCPNSTLRGTAKLQGWKFVIGPRGYASINSDTEKVTHGAIWLLSEYDEKELDKCEGVSIGLYRKEEIEVEFEGASVECLVYIENQAVHKSASLTYRNKILAGAEALSLPLEYVDELKAELNR